MVVALAPVRREHRYLHLCLRRLLLPRAQRHDGIHAERLLLWIHERHLLRMVLALGTVGHKASLTFVRHIYGAIKWINRPSDPVAML